MIRRVAVVAWLVAVWIALWGQLSVANLASGLVVAVVLLVVFPTADEPAGQVRFAASVRYVVYFAGQLLLATWQVVVATIVPAGRVAPGVVAVPLRARSPLITTIVGNSVTLTPGTLTVDVVDGADGSVVLLIHALDLSDPDAVRRGTWDFEERAVAAFGTADDRTALAGGGV